jgi:hypothetical protein
MIEIDAVFALIAVYPSKSSENPKNEAVRGVCDINIGDRGCGVKTSADSTSSITPHLS